MYSINVFQEVEENGRQNRVKLLMKFLEQILLVKINMEICLDG